jgi:hypothetical protein
MDAETEVTHQVGYRRLSGAPRIAAADMLLCSKTLAQELQMTYRCLPSSEAHCGKHLGDLHFKPSCLRFARRSGSTRTVAVPSRCSSVEVRSLTKVSFETRLTRENSIDHVGGHFGP